MLGAKDSIFDIDMSDWNIVSFGDIAMEPKETIKDPVSYGVEHVVGLEHIDPNDIVLSKYKTLEDSTTFTKAFRKGDVLFGRRRAYLRKAAKADFDGICSGDITVIRAKEGLLPELLPFIVNNNSFFDHAIKHSAGGLSPRVKFKDLSLLQLNLPPESEQHEICEVLQRLEEVISSYRNLLDSLENYSYVKSVEYFNNGLETTRPQNIVVPDGWSLLPVKEIIPNIEYGISISIPKNETPDGIPIFSTAEISVNGDLNIGIVRSINYEKELIERLVLKNNDLLFNWRNSAELIGKTAIFEKPENDSRDFTFASFLLRMRCDEINAHNMYFKYLFNFYRKSGVFLGMARKAVNQANFNKNEVYDLLVPVPPYEKQVEIAKVLYEQEKQKKKISKQIDNSIDLRNSILDELF